MSRILYDRWLSFANFATRAFGSSQSLTAMMLKPLALYFFSSFSR